MNDHSRMLQHQIDTLVHDIDEDYSDIVRAVARYNRRIDEINAFCADRVDEAIVYNLEDRVLWDRHFARIDCPPSTHDETGLLPGVHR